MEWTDTLMFESTSRGSADQSTSAKSFTRTVALQNGATLLCASTKSRTETASALELLRGFRATGRRVVLCDTSQLVVGRQFGREVVERGRAQMLVSCGIGGREVGIGARDAGLELSNVVVCGKPEAGGHVLANQITAGDTVLLLGLDSKACEEIVAQLEMRFSHGTAVAA